MTLSDRRMSRRDFLLGVGGGVVAAAGAAALAGCGPTTRSALTATDGPPKRGGTLTCGFTGGGSGDKLDPLNPVSLVDNSRIYQLFEPLVVYSTEAVPQLLLAEEITPNKDATQWTIRLRSGITFHNGKDLTADDVIYTFRRILDPKAPASGAAGISSVDAKALRKLDNLTVSVPCTRPFATFMEVLPTNVYFVVPEGFDLSHPVGTGPFKFESFTPGVQSTFVRYDNYWQTGLPYVDTVVINDFQDETSQINGLLSNQVDLIDVLSAESISSVQQGGGEIVISSGGGINPFTMRVDVSPFSDVRVRQAMRLLVNRQQMLDLVFNGHGTIGNDVFGIWDPDYDHHLPQREADPEKARFLLKQAGVENMTFTLMTAGIAQGIKQTAEVFAQQAMAAGIHVTLQQTTATEFFGPNYLHWPFAQDEWFYNGYFPQVSDCMLSTSAFNETHWSDPEYVSLYNQAQATTDVAKRTSIAYEMQAIDYERGGYVIPYFPPVIDGYATRIHGVHPSKTGLSFDKYDFKTMWID
jgi:peptide/nickel transport system substrate-binding protein